MNKPENRLRSLATLAVALLGVAVAIVSCAPTELGCDAYSTCQHGGASGNSATGGAGANHAGTAGNNGGSLSGASGNNSENGGSSGDGLEQAGASGAGASGATAPCKGACENEHPVCNEATDTCVECLAPSDCKTPKPACNVTTNTCVECVGKSDCKSPKGACDTATNTCVECTESQDCSSPKPLCDTKAQTCVACLADADCKDPAAARCDAGICKPCTDKSQCTHLAGKGVCDVGPGQCVQCTGTDYGACGKDITTQTPLVCDSLAHTCSTNKEHDAGLCIPCVSDANCKQGEMCALQKFQGASVGYFCHWKQGDTANGAPADCTAGGQPYVGVINDAKSVDGQTADVCTLAKSTCVARNDFRQKDCAAASVANDSLCGFSPPDDAKCAKFGTTTFRCTMRCLSSDDCPGTTCDTGLAQPMCTLQ